MSTSLFYLSFIERQWSGTACPSSVAESLFPAASLSWGLRFKNSWQECHHPCQTCLHWTLTPGHQVRSIYREFVWFVSCSGADSWEDIGPVSMGHESTPSTRSCLSHLERSSESAGQETHKTGTSCWADKMDKERTDYMHPIRCCRRTWKEFMACLSWMSVVFHNKSFYWMNQNSSLKVRIQVFKVTMKSREPGKAAVSLSSKISGKAP